jgi:hypothetical protein
MRPVRSRPSCSTGSAGTARWKALGSRPPSRRCWWQASRWCLADPPSPAGWAHGPGTWACAPNHYIPTMTFHHPMAVFLAYALAFASQHLTAPVTTARSSGPRAAGQAP